MAEAMREVYCSLDKGKKAGFLRSQYPTQEVPMNALPKSYVEAVQPLGFTTSSDEIELSA